jgi:hypothetical protein
MARRSNVEVSGASACIATIVAAMERRSNVAASGASACIAIEAAMRAVLT